MAEKEAKVTTMVLKVDLKCPDCYKKVKKVLCKYPQIRDQVYDEKENKVIIKVVCCSPEKIRDKLCSKGGRSIESIEIKKEPEKKPEKEKPKGEEKKPEKKPDEKQPDKKPEEKPPAGKPKEAEKPKESEKKPEKEKPKEGEKQAAKQPAEAPVPTAIPILLPPLAYPAMGFSCPECYRSGTPGGPCFHGGTVVQYDGYYGRPVYDSWGGGGGYRGGYGNRYDYFSEENQQGCSIM
ncbi:hypothetical protein SLEP1_g26001 [Rubroshorea leprosula]|uniref:Uncharacterized protein n=1 Tax=Rubroshorea leprosula TaxID=152421 RepID=A0AAV5JKW0_9ROSI|nr:hypothetical protein SLEP1_g26001 [Rubroshorea leprosula]